MELPTGQQPFDCVEVRFKNSRKEIFRNVNNLPLLAGDVIAVEASPGHDIGVVSLTGELVRMQMKRRNVDEKAEDIKKIYRKARQADIDKWKEAQDLENPTMYKARTIASRLKLEMKISDVEYQGDRTKAIFYYTADDRVDFRELIKVLAEEFKVRIEMRQIGARQEASRLGGIGSCGRELCCSTWLTDFRSVSTSAARYQQLSLNPLKLAGQCGKLKCCLNYELDSYLDAIKDFPDSNIKLEAEKGKAFHQKTDIFKRIMYFSYTDEPDTFISVSVDRVKEIVEMNKNGQKPDDIAEEIEEEEVKKEPDYENVVGQDSINRFDTTKKKRKKKKKSGGPREGSENANPNAQQRPQGQQRPPRQQGQQKPRPEGQQKPRPEGQQKPRPEGQQKPRHEGQQRRPEGQPRQNQPRQNEPGKGNKGGGNQRRNNKPRNPNGPNPSGPPPNPQQN
jgi:cell fate regulator YaaT (PSP1 superfamily)